MQGLFCIRRRRQCCFTPGYSTPDSGINLTIAVIKDVDDGVGDRVQTQPLAAVHRPDGISGFPPEISSGQSVCASVFLYVRFATPLIGLRSQCFRRYWSCGEVYPLTARCVTTGWAITCLSH